MSGVERPMIVLPCGHMADRPTKPAARVNCNACPRSYSLTLDAGGRVWSAREVELEVPS